jgi:eukaryotic-like serine/threonine-protein kinase
MDEYGRYEIVAEVGRGSTATVYRARHREIGRIAAIKELLPPMLATPDATRRFRDEAQLLASFDDPHIVAIYDFVEEPQRIWIAEEWVDGVTLQTLVASAGRLTPEQSLGVLRGALLGLAYAHGRDVLHGDLSPSNIIADTLGTSKLIDFGLSAPIGQGGLVGTPLVMSPESIRGEATTKASDVYAVGVLLYLLLAGRPPFTGATVDEVMQQHLDTPPPALREHGAGLASLVADALGKDPQQRPPDAQAFLDRLETGAQDRYGVGWLERASIAGLVTAALGGAAEVSAASGAGPAAASGATALISGTVRTGHRRGWVLGGVGALAAAVVVIILLTSLVGGNNKTKPAATTSSLTSSVAVTSTSSTATSPVPPPVVAPAGHYRLTSRVTSTTIPHEKVGADPTRTWTVHLTCAGATCTGTIHSTSGTTFNATLDGAELHISYDGTGPGSCTSNDTGKVIPSAKVVETVHTTGVLHVDRRSSGSSPAAGTPLTLTGTEHVRVLLTGVTGVCRGQVHHYRDTTTLTLTYVSG